MEPLGVDYLKILLVCIPTTLLAVIYAGQRPDVRETQAAYLVCGGFVRFSFAELFRTNLIYDALCTSNGVGNLLLRTTRHPHLNDLPVPLIEVKQVVQPTEF